MQQAGSSVQPIAVSVDGTVVDTITPTSTAFGSYTTPNFTLTAGPHTFDFSATEETTTGISFLDTVSLNDPPPPQAPSAPSGLTATAASPSTVNLSWTPASGSAATGYPLEISTDGKTFTTIATAPAGASSYQINGLTPGTAYTFEIAATNAGGTSPVSNTATATTPANATTLTNINFSNGFTGASSTLALNGTTALSGTRLRLTSGITDQEGTAFTLQPVSVAAFTTQFQFQLTNPNADGFTFTIQGNSPTAMGTDPSGGGGLGFEGLTKSVAVKFDLYNNNGEGTDSTGLFTNGATTPTTPSNDLTSTGVNLHSGDIFSVAMTYNGTTLNLTVTDTTTGATATESYSVNIPSIVGGNTAYVGFTAASGGETATQDILNWTYAPTTPLPNGWTNADIGAPTLAGSTTDNNGTFTVTGGGIDIWNTDDQFQFVSQPQTGNGNVSAQVESQTNTNAWAKAGVMILRVQRREFFLRRRRPNARKRRRSSVARHLRQPQLDRRTDHHRPSLGQAHASRQHIYRLCLDRRQHMDHDRLRNDRDGKFHPRRSCRHKSQRGRGFHGDVHECEQFHITRRAHRARRINSHGRVDHSSEFVMDC